FLRQSIIWYGLITTHWDVAHTFCTTGDDAVCHSALDFCGCDGDSFQSRSAITVYGHPWNIDCVQSHQGNKTAHIQPLFGFGHCIAHDYVVNAFFVQLWYLLHHIADGFCGEFVRTFEAEESAWCFAYGGAVGFYYICSFHSYWVSFFYYESGAARFCGFTAVLHGIFRLFTIDGAARFCVFTTRGYPVQFFGLLII